MALWGRQSVEYLAISGGARQQAAHTLPRLRMGKPQVSPVKSDSEAQCWQTTLYSSAPDVAMPNPHPRRRVPATLPHDAVQKARAS